jgi:glutamyl-tRNA reductase
LERYFKLPFLVTILHLLFWWGLPIQAVSLSQIGFIGLGAMGYRMADNLTKSGHEIVVHDRSIAKMEEFCKREGLQSTTSPAALAQMEGHLAKTISLRHTADCIVS